MQGHPESEISSENMIKKSCFLFRSLLASVAEIPAYSHKWNPAAAKQPWWLCGINSTWLWLTEKNPQPDPDLQTISIERGCDTKNN